MVSLREGVVETGGWNQVEEKEASPRMDPRPGQRETGVSGGWSQRLSLLARTVETEIIPRLVTAERPDAPQAAGAEVSQHVSPHHVKEFSAVLVADEAGAPLAYVDAMRARGTPLDSLYLELLQPTARNLGDLWTADLCSFTDVTIGLWRLHQILRQFSPLFHEQAYPRHHDARALVAPAPGEQHTFGLHMVCEFLRRTGWDVSNGAPATAEDLVGTVRREWFGVVGLSLSCEHRLDALSSVIRDIRRASCNRAIGIMVGGSVFIEHPELAPLVGADTTAQDGRQAAAQAESLLGALAQRS